MAANTYTPDLTLSTAIVNNPLLPVTWPGNIATNREAYDERTWNEAMNMADQSVRVEAIRNMDRTTQTQLAEWEYWQKNFPTVELRAVDNPHVDSDIMHPLRAWNDAWGSPPLVNVRVTPRKKPLPEASFLSSVLTYVGPVLGVIPGIGQVAMAAAQIIGAAAAQSWAASFQYEPDSFKPQYYPEPFYIVLPLDRAKLIVGTNTANWYMLPAAAEAFRRELELGVVYQAADSLQQLRQATYTAQAKSADQGLTFVNPTGLAAPLSGQSSVGAGMGTDFSKILLPAAGALAAYLILSD